MNDPHDDTRCPCGAPCHLNARALAAALQTQLRQNDRLREHLLQWVDLYGTRTSQLALDSRAFLQEIGALGPPDHRPIAPPRRRT